MHTRNGKLRPALLMAMLGGVFGGCDDLLEVSDPQRYTSDDLDQSLTAVAAGIEGDLYATLDNLYNAVSLNSDEMQHTGTWIGYDDLDHGRFRFSNASGGGGLGSGDDAMNGLLRTRFAAQEGQARFERVLEGEAGSSRMMAVAQVVEGWTNLLLAQNFCEAPAEQGGVPVSDVEMGKLAVAELTTAMQRAEAAGAPDLRNQARAGRARANLLLGNYDAALADAQAVPDGFIWNASYSSNSGRQYNGIVQLSTAGQNRASGVREFWWPRVDTVADAMRDPYTGQVDRRLPVLFDGKFGVDGITPHYSQWKYRDLGADMPITDWREMRLIEAEVAWRKNDLAAAQAKMNALRATVGLSPLPATNDRAKVLEYLLHERFAELFIEGQRMSDLHRFGVVGQYIAENRFGNQTNKPRPTKFPMSFAEVLNSQGIEDKASSSRCLPMSS